MRNEVNNDYYDLAVEIDDLIMKQSEKGSDHCRFEGSQQRECDDTSGIYNDCLK